ncbi:MAG: carboxylesterase [Edafosvirus sp.]|uniref:Carboxylesterase n=1 Tax=Edafosvirus sp. TaxID=2487765 RepID=A0A3G4ZSF1_9VIRU|nr:MAG: carboxylesterase [Edafosvirus sp.]
MNNKYLKYKNKYLQLKSQTGGSDNNLQKLEPTTKKFIESLNAKEDPPLYTLLPQDARKVLNDLQSESINISMNSTDVKIDDFSITIYKPENIKTQYLPVLIYYHGGGWILGNNLTHKRLIHEIISKIDIAVVFVNYTPSPEADCLKILEQCYKTLLYISQFGEKYNLDKNSIAVGGDSAGGCIAISVALLTHERKGPVIKYKMLLYPVTDANMNTMSYNQYSNGPWLTKKSMEWFWNAYCPDMKLRNNYLISPINSTSDQLIHMPPTLVITDENDVLRDEGEAYAHKLISAGVNVVAIRYLGTIHDFLMLNTLANTPASKNAISLIIDNLNKNLIGI